MLLYKLCLDFICIYIYICIHIYIYIYIHIYIYIGVGRQFINAEDFRSRNDSLVFEYCLRNSPLSQNQVLLLVFTAKLMDCLVTSAKWMVTF